MSAFDKSAGQAGFSLIEVLVTLVILAFGLLGLAGMQSVGLKNSQGSLVRSKATLFAYDIIDRMRSNCSAALGGDYNIGISASTPTGSSMAAVDVAQWRNGISSALPSGTGSVAVNAASSTVTVVIRWDDSRSTGGNSAQAVTVTGVLPAAATCQAI